MCCYYEREISYSADAFLSSSFFALICAMKNYYSYCELERFFFFFFFLKKKSWDSTVMYTRSSQRVICLSTRRGTSFHAVFPSFFHVEAHPQRRSGGRAGVDDDERRWPRGNENTLRGPGPRLSRPTAQTKLSVYKYDIFLPLPLASCLADGASYEKWAEKLRTT